MTYERHKRIEFMSRWQSRSLHTGTDNGKWRENTKYRINPQLFFVVVAVHKSGFYSRSWSRCRAVAHKIIIKSNRRNIECISILCREWKLLIHLTSLIWVPSNCHRMHFFNGFSIAFYSWTTILLLSATVSVVWFRCENTKKAKTIRKRF